MLNSMDDFKVLKFFNLSGKVRNANNIVGLRPIHMALPLGVPTQQLLKSSFTLTSSEEYHKTLVILVL